MKTYLKKVTVEYTEEYLPTPRCRKMHTRIARKEATVSIRTVTSKEAPMAFVMHDFHHTESFRDRPEIRRYEDSLYSPVTEACLFCGGTKEIVRPDNEHFHLIGDFPRWEDFDNGLSAKQKCADKYLVIDGLLWEKCGEPRYAIVTLGLGHNHGGTVLSIDTCYNCNIPKTRYFNALHRKEAVAEAKRIAIARGDTESIETFDAEIEVFDPSAVKCDPAKEHGDGDPFLNTLEKITEGAKSVNEAGMLAILATAKSFINHRREI